MRKNKYIKKTPSIMNREILEHTLTPCMKINSKFLRDLNIRHDIIKLLEENIGKIFSDMSLTHIFSSHSPKATEMRAK